MFLKKKKVSKSVNTEIDPVHRIRSSQNLTPTKRSSKRTRSKVNTYNSDSKKESFKIWYRRNLKHLRLLLYLLLTIVIFASVKIIADNSDIFDIRNIEVTAFHKGELEHTNADDVEKYLRESLEGLNYFDITNEVLSAEIINEFPYVERTFIEKRLPDSLFVELVERRPF